MAKKIKWNEQIARGRERYAKLLDQARKNVSQEKVKSQRKYVLRKPTAPATRKPDKLVDWYAFRSNPYNLPPGKPTFRQFGLRVRTGGIPAGVVIPPPPPPKIPDIDFIFGV